MTIQGPDAAQKLAVCREHAEALAKANPSIDVFYSERNVIVRTDGHWVLAYSWTITGKFIDLTDSPQNLAQRSDTRALFAVERTEGQA